MPIFESAVAGIVADIKTGNPHLELLVETVALEAGALQLVAAKLDAVTDDPERIAEVAAALDGLANSYNSLKVAQLTPAERQNIKNLVHILVDRSNPEIDALLEDFFDRRLDFKVACEQLLAESLNPTPVETPVDEDPAPPVEDPETPVVPEDETPIVEDPPIPPTLDGDEG